MEKLERGKPKPINPKQVAEEWWDSLTEERRKEVFIEIISTTDIGTMEIVRNWIKEERKHHDDDRCRKKNKKKAV